MWTTFNRLHYCQLKALSTTIVATMARIDDNGRSIVQQTWPRRPCMQAIRKIEVSLSPDPPLGIMMPPSQSPSSNTASYRHTHTHDRLISSRALMRFECLDGEKQELSPLRRGFLVRQSSWPIRGLPSLLAGWLAGWLLQSVHCRSVVFELGADRQMHLEFPSSPSSHASMLPEHAGS